ncbi:5-formyltetrahydrofolate cyclo-ligase isoform X2 [Agelaius phoeniceus]|uniref:5-formyltetrahydrofolate cyclo-ligase isoform X2 n=1 Tax=Agelaius phoeniceus TaxID=39638 RepID=UPI004054C616
MERAGDGGAMAAALRAAKQQLRAELRQRLRALGAAEKQRQSRLLGRKVIDHPKYQESKRIAIFLSMPDEVQTEEIIKDIFKQGKECFIPRYKPQSNHMDMLKLSSAEDMSSLALTSWNILQPSDDDTAREEALAGVKLFCRSSSHCSFNIYNLSDVILEKKMPGRKFYAQEVLTLSSCQALGLTKKATDWEEGKDIMIPILKDV